MRAQQKKTQFLMGTKEGFGVKVCEHLVVLVMIAVNTDIERDKFPKERFATKISYLNSR